MTFRLSFSASQNGQRMGRLGYQNSHKSAKNRPARPYRTKTAILRVAAASPHPLHSSGVFLIPGKINVSQRR
jgi:hypothetical protein